MTDPDHQAFDDLVKAAITMFVIVGDESYFLAQTHKDNPEIGASEVVILTITRKHIPPIMKPLPLKEYEAEIKEVLIPA